MEFQGIIKEWWKYLAGLFNVFGNPTPQIFQAPHCGTCHYWQIIAEEDLRAIPNPYESERIKKGSRGEVLKTFNVPGFDPDIYNDHEFFGWCKRYPPIPTTAYSILGWRTLFSKVSRKIPMSISEAAFPIMPHENWCGEWKRAHWVKNFIENKGKLPGEHEDIS